jgi:hypothetical protein
MVAYNLTPCLGLRELVLVVREVEVDAAAVDVHRLAQRAGLPLVTHVILQSKHGSINDSAVWSM